MGDVKTQIKAGESGFPRQVGTNNPQVHKIRDPLLEELQENFSLNSTKNF